MTEGVLLLDKPPGTTSFQALGAVKRLLRTGRVGHAGTLDRFAEGLLLVMTGRMTRLCPFATSLDKEYVARISFGQTTDTLDPEGRVVAEGPVPDRRDVEAALPAFLGITRQLPPAYSAVHVAGRRAYHAARAGESVVIAPREVRIDRLELTSWSPPEATLLVTCGKGTYVRSLARDLAERLGTCAFVSALTRTRIGGFQLADAHRPDMIDPSLHLLPPERFFDAAPALGRLTLKEQIVPRVGNGMPLSPSCFECVPARDGIYGAFSPEGTLIAVVDRRGESWRYAAVFPGPPSGGRVP